MAELKQMEVIMRIDFAMSDGEQVAVHAEKVQELVRCSDCKHNPETAWFGCPMAGTKRRSDEDFCSFGEREDNDME